MDTVSLLYGANAGPCKSMYTFYRMTPKTRHWEFKIIEKRTNNTLGNATVGR